MKNLFLLIILVLLACNSAKKNNNEIHSNLTKKASFPQIIFLNNYYFKYLQDLKNNPYNEDSLFNFDIKYPIIQKFKNSEFIYLLNYQLSYRPKDTTGLRTRIEVLNKEKLQISKIITQTLSRCKKYLPNNVIIYICPVMNSNKIINEMNGLDGFTAGSKQILISIDPNVRKWESWLPYTVSHEFNHAYWIKKNFTRTTTWTLLSYLIFEGKADYFAHFINKTQLGSWDTALTLDQKKELWKELKNKLDTTDRYFQSNVMFGLNGYPQWCGYSIGYSIVSSALKNYPKITPEQWTNMDPEKILKLSNINK
jgi:uncharacterized protein YjaZ